MLKNILLSVLMLSMPGTAPKQIVWGSKTLEWSDFRGKQETNRFSIASTYSEILLSFPAAQKDLLTAEVKNVFYPELSWTITDDQSVLEHERGHFDLGEVYARKIRKQLSETAFEGPDVKKKAQQLFNTLNEEQDWMQDRYDDETESSMNGREQRRWKKLIAEQLAALKSYEKSTVTLRVK